MLQRSQMEGSVVMRKLILLTVFFFFFSAAQAFAQGASSPQQLLEAYEAALRAKDLQAYMSLVSLSRDEDRPGVEMQFRQRFNATLTSAKMLPFSAFEAEYKRATRHGAKPSIEPQGWLVVDFAPQQLSTGATATYKDVLIFGLRNGRYYFGS